jgi:hypothetical protein
MGAYGGGAGCAGARPGHLKTKPVYYYNLGCYLARLGQDERALQLLKQSFEMDGDLRRECAQRS